MSKFHYGGQAVTEGVMMRGRYFYTIAVRTPDGGISVHKEWIHSWFSRWPALRKPLLRGAVVFAESVVLGTKCRLDSACRSHGDVGGPESSSHVLFGLVWTAMLAVGLFVALPGVMVSLLQDTIASTPVLNVLEGLLKVGLLVGAAVLARLWPTYRRLFQYHGAEHMVINCWETKRSLKLEQVRRCSPIQVRCGMSFLLLAIVMSVVVIGVFGRPAVLERVLLHLAIWPVALGLAFEVMLLAGRDPMPRWVRGLILPGIVLQYVTTANPDDQQLEVAVTALKEAIAADRQYQESRKVIPFPLPAS